MRESTLVSEMDTRLRGYDTTSGKIEIGKDSIKFGWTIGTFPWLAVTQDGLGRMVSAYALAATGITSIQQLYICWRIMVMNQVGEEMAVQEQIKRSVTIYAEIGREEDTWHAEIWQLTE